MSTIDHSRSRHRDARQDRHRRLDRAVSAGQPWAGAEAVRTHRSAPAARRGPPAPKTECPRGRSAVERFHRNGDAGSRGSPNGPVLDYCRAVLQTRLQTRHRTVLTVAFYAAVAGVLAAILFQVLPVFLPDSVAGRIGHNSEGLLLALILAGWIQFVRPRLAGTRREWTVTIFGAVLPPALGIFLIVTALPSRFRTLNEALLAGALLVPYVQVRRPVPGRIALWLAGGTLVLTVVFNQ